MLLGEARHVYIAHQFRRRRDATLGHSRRQGKRWDQGDASQKRLPIIEPWSSPASFHEVRRGRALEGQFVADVADDALFQRVREVNARIAACDLRNLRYEYANSIARASGSPPRTMSVTTPTRTPCVRSAGVATAGTFPRVPLRVDGSTR